MGEHGKRAAVVAASSLATLTEAAQAVVAAAERQGVRLDVTEVERRIVSLVEAHARELAERIDDLSEEEAAELARCAALILQLS